MPTDDDVLKARLKTVGVSEYKFEMEVSAGRDSGTEWRIVDVGGSRSQRRMCFLSPILSEKALRFLRRAFVHMQRRGRLFLTTVRDISVCAELHTRYRYVLISYWTVDAIIFLAPISGFDQVLAEDRTVNRLVRLLACNYIPLILRPVTGRLRPPLESRLLLEIAGQRGPRAVPQQVRHPGEEAEF